MTPQEKPKYPELMDWFDFMNSQFEKIKDSHEKGRINNILIDNDIDLIE